ncbi:DEAD/DEAH box helicase [Tessaracoccus coleopterorum]|uniref:DEAD/DEAH box helicase n=1 Tax=Tessaracoccus coleopterorum TaxID=2714950 RepID=UPI0038CD65A8
MSQSRADYTYGYAEALADHVVRPVLFMNYGGPMRWRTKSGDELAADLGVPMTKDLTSAAWRTALAPQGEWVSAVLRAADRRLTEVRRHVPDAGGLVIATNQTTARAYAKLLTDLTGRRPCVVLSDDSKASARIDEFSASEDRWMVAVRMVSEGVDVPGSPSASTPPRRRHRCSSPRPWVASCAAVAAARWRPCSCRRCPSCSRMRPPSNASATT